MRPAALRAPILQAPALRALALGAFLAVTACAAAPPAGPPSGPDLVSIPLTEADGTRRTIPARLCRPASDSPAPLVVVSHGSPGEDRFARARYAPLPCTHEVARWFTSRGYAVLAPLRRGYGEDRGPWAESYGPCATPDYVRAGRETARDIAAAVAAARAIPGLRPDGTILVGQSAGGWGSLALAADPPPGVVAVVNVAGGRGGHQGNRPNDNCRPDRLIADAGALAGRLPTLWLYTANDTFFAPDLARAMHASYVAAGGRADLRQLGPWGADGHDMFYGRGGSLTWGPAIEPFLAAPR